MVTPTGLLQCTTVWRVRRAAASRTIHPERRRSTCHWNAAPRPHHADFATTALVARTAIEYVSRSLSWSSSVYTAMHRPICQTSMTSSHLWRQHAPTSAPPTQRRALFDVRTTSSAIAVSHRLDDACGTRCAPNYDNATLREFKRLIKPRLLAGHWAFWHFLVKSDV